MNSFFIDIGLQSYCKKGELLCGDHTEIVRGNDGSAVIVLADGLGSGVKANILSTLTTKIISTMIANEMSIEECVRAVAATLPVCGVRKIAYSTFTIIRIDKALNAEIIQFDNPRAILLRKGKSIGYPEISEKIDEKTIYISHIKLCENDTFIAVSDGVIHAGIEHILNFGWQRDEVINFMENMYKDEYTARALATILSDECLLLYDDQPGDDVTVCAVKVRKRTPVNLLIGPPASPDDVTTMMSLFFSKEGKHIVCGGTTSQLAAEYLNKPLRIDGFDYTTPDIPPTASIEGVDLVTEGVITINKVLECANDYLGDNHRYLEWHRSKSGASQILKLLIEEATDINFYVGRAINPAHQNPDLPINFNIKMRLVEELSESLKQMGKRIKVSYF